VAHDSEIGARQAPVGPPSLPLPLHSELHGEEGPPLLLIHGFGTNGYTWSRWVPNLSRDHQVHVVELKGFGDAPKPRDGRYSPLEQASLLYRWILQKDLRNLTMVGHSLGGGVALLSSLRLQREDPGRLRGLVLVAATAYPQPLSRYLRFLGRPRLGPLALRVLPRRLIIRTALRQAYHPSNPVSHTHVEAYAHPLGTPEGRYALSRSASQLIPPELESIAAQYPEVKVPSLLLWGREDPVVPLWVGERLAKALPTARLEVLPECGHMPQEEAAQDSLERLQRFLREVT